MPTSQYLPRRQSVLAVAVVMATVLSLFGVAAPRAHAAGTTPSAPLNVTVTNYQGGSHIEWDAPSSDGGNAIIGYILKKSGYSYCATPAAVRACDIPNSFGSMVATSMTVEAYNSEGSGTTTSFSVAPLPENTYMAAASWDGELSKKLAMASSSTGVWVLTENGLYKYGNAAATIGTKLTINLPNTMVYPTYSSNSSTYFYRTLAVSGDYVYVITDNYYSSTDRIYVLNDSDGSIVSTFTYTPTSNETPRATIVAGGNLIMSSSNRLVAFNVTDGSEVWSKSSSFYAGGRAMTTDGSSIWVSTPDGCSGLQDSSCRRTTYKINPSTGAVLATIAAASDGGLAYTSGEVFGISAGNHGYITRNGTFGEWDSIVNIDASTDAVTPYYYKLNAKSIIGTSGYLVALNSDSSVSLINPADGTIYSNNKSADYNVFRGLLVYPEISTYQPFGGAVRSGNNFAFFGYSTGAGPLGMAYYKFQPVAAPPPLFAYKDQYGKRLDATVTAGGLRVSSMTGMSFTGALPVSMTFRAYPGNQSCTVNMTNFPRDPANPGYVYGWEKYSCTITGLTALQNYWVSVTETNALGTSAETWDGPTYMPAVPDAPTNVSLGAGSSSNWATVTWTPPTNDGGSAITGYTATIKSGSNTASCQANQPTSTTCNVYIGSLRTGTYIATVVATNAAGDSAASSNSAGYSIVILTTPSQSRNVSVSPSSGTLTVSWDAPTDGGGGTISSYTAQATRQTTVPTNLQSFSQGSTSSKYLMWAGANSKSAISTVATVYKSSDNSQVATCTPGYRQIGCTVMGLTGSTNYYFKVVETYSDTTTGTSEASSTFVTANTFEQPSGGNYTPDGTCSWSSGPLTCDITGLTNGVAYYVVVIASNGTYSSYAGATGTFTPRDMAGAPTGVTATGGNGQATISWTTPSSDGGSPITSYTATAYDDQGNSAGTCTATAPDVSCTITGLTNGSSYTFKVVATNGNGSGTPSTASSSLVVGNAPQAPTNVTTSAGNGSVTVSWTAPSSNGGVSISGYTATASPGGASCTSSGTSCTISGLTNGTSYTFSVVATNAVGTSSSSTPSSSVAPQADVPGAPTGVSASGGNGQATVSWSAPTNDGGAPIDGYIVTASPGGATCTAVAPATSCVIRGLTNGTSYTFSVVATNNTGNSTSSSPSTGVTPAAGPSQPDRFQATPSNHGLTFHWTAPTSGPAPTSYTVTLSPSGKTCTVDLVLHPSAALSCTFSGLNNGTPYTATITASIAGGASITDAIIARPSSLGNVPSAPREVIFRGSTAGVATVTWKVSASNGGSPISRYVVFIKGTRFAKSCAVNVGSNPNAALRCTISGLKPKRFYSYRVAAFNGAGSGGTAEVRRALDIDVRIASFARGKTTLWSGLARQASITAKYIKKFKFNKVVVTGYTNPNGSVASRIASTQARALTVANFINKRLKALGIKNVTVTAAGSGTALYKHPNAKQRKLNRSVSTYLSYN